MTVKTKSVMIIDDFPALLQVLPRILENKGFKAITMSNGVDALEYLTQNQIDIMVTDLEMPAMSGIELFAKVRALKFQFPIIFMSGNVGKYDPSDIMMADAFLGKPFPVDDLLELINSFI